MSEVPDFAEALSVAQVEDIEGGDIPIFNQASVAAAVVDRAGAVICASDAFHAMRGGQHVDASLVADVVRGAGPLTTAVALEGGADTAIFAYALAGQTGGWRLPPAVREATRAHPGHVVVLTSLAAGAARPLEDACRTHGLSGLQTRVVMETVRTGNVRTAADALGVTYHTAREAMSEALRRTSAPGLPALVARLTSLAFGVLPKADASEVLGDLWGLTPRQAAVAALVASGASRAATARALGVSEAVARKELEVVHLVLQVGSAAALARKVVEADALRWLTNATGGDIGFIEASTEPLRFVGRPDGSRIAISDYGPPGGRPVLVVHSSTTSRIVSRSLLRALHAAGFRPIAIDRPGFGLTDEIEGLKAGAHDPFAAAARDAVLVLDHLRIRRIDLVARGAAQFALALQRAAPGRLRRAVLVNPDPHAGEGGQPAGPVAATKELYRRNPAVIRFLAGIYIRGVTYEHAARHLARGAKGSPADERAVRDPEVVRDYFHALRTFATGRIEGFINEQTYFATAGWPEPLPGAEDWRVLVGGDDFVHDPERVAAYWRIVLPDTPVAIVPDTGRFLAMSRPDLVVQALAWGPGG